MPNLQHLRRSFWAEAVYRIAAVLFCTPLVLVSSIAMAGADPQLAHPEARVAETMAVHLADKDDCKRQEARRAMVRIGSPAVPFLVKALEHPQASVRRLAAETLGSIKPPTQDAVPALIAHLKDGSRGVRTACLEALRRIGGPREQVMDAIASALGDGDPYVREAAASALGYIGRDAKAAAPLLKKLRDDDHDEAVRAAADAALKHIGPTTLLDYAAAYYGYPLLLLLAGLVYRLILRGKQDKLKALHAFIPACFGHPVYLLLAAYVTAKIGLAAEVRHGTDLSIAGYTAVLLLLFLLRFGFFLHMAWVNTRSSFAAVYPHAAAAYFRVHRYGVLGLPLFVWLLFPIPSDETAILYFLVFFPACIAGVFQTIMSVATAAVPEKWAPPDEIIVEHEKEGVDRAPLAPEEERKRNVSSALLFCVGLLIVGAGVTLQMPDREKEGGQELHFKRMLAREQPGSAQYHLMLGQSYSGFYPVNPRIDLDEGHARALVEYNRAIELDPNLAWAYKQRAHSYSRLKEYARAVEDYNTYERLSDVVDWQFYGGRASAYRNLGMMDRMCEDSLKAYCGDHTHEGYKRLVQEGLCR